MNDADIITETVTEIAETIQHEYEFFEILIIDNASTDDSVEKIRALQTTIPNIRLIVLSRNNGTEIGFTAALENSIGDYVVLLDIEHDPPSLIPTLVAAAVDGVDIVIAERKDRSDNTFLRNIFSVMFYKLYARISGFIVIPNASNFRVLTRRAVNSITRIKSKGRYLKHFHALVGFSQLYIPYERVYRRQPPKPQEPLFQLVWRAIDVMISHSLIPLRLATLLGVLASFLNLLFIFYVFIVSLIKKTHIAEGWISTSLVNSTMFFILFFILTVISEYIARVLIESKDQPLYFIAEEYNSTIISNQHNKKVNVV